MNLWRRGLGEVPESVWPRTDLEVLVLADNGLTELSPKIGLLRRLRTLDLGHNALGTVPDEVAELPALTDFLYLHDNRLTGLPESLGRPTRLHYLNVSENNHRTPYAPGPDHRARHPRRGNAPIAGGDLPRGSSEPSWQPDFSRWEAATIAAG